MSSTNRKAASGRDTEQAPVLADDAASGYDDSDIGDGDEGDSKRGRVRTWLTQAWHWLLSNLMAVAIILLLLGGVIALCVYIAVVNNAKTSAKSGGICLSPACVLAASEILESVSPRYRDIDPCTDFDKFICEGWVEKHDLRADQGESFTGTIMGENSQRILRHVLESPYQIDSQNIEVHSVAKQEIFNKLHDAYEACMSEDIIRKSGSAPLLNVLRKIEQLFPASRPHQGSDTFSASLNSVQEGLLVEHENNLSKTMAYMTRIGVDALVTFNVAADDRNPDVVVPFISAPRQPGLPSKEYYKDPMLVVKYAETIGRVLEALLHEADPNSHLLESIRSHFSTNNAGLVKDLVVFESELAKATPATEEAGDVTKYYNPLDLDETTALIPQLSIRYLVSTLTPSGFKPDRLIVGSPSYLKTVSRLLDNTSAETLQAYFVWKTVQTYANRVEDDALRPLKRFNNELQGKDPDVVEERWRTCIKVVDNGLGWIMSIFFVEKAFSAEAKNFGDRIVSDIKDQFIRKLKQAEWMSKDVRKLAIEKVHNIVQKIGYPTQSPDIRDSSALLKYYESVNISNATFFENTLSMSMFKTEREWAALGKPTDRDEWGMTADTVNAYYNPAGNEIVFPAGIMQAPMFYNPSIPRYLSYGAFGSVSGHELSHAFDSTGRHYDETGNFTDWWDDKTVQSFEERAQCFIDQYNDFIVPNPNGKPLHVNGRLTLGENIADAGGLNAAFAAWKEMDDDEPDKLLPGLQEFSKEQIFFMSYSNSWCGKMRPEIAVNLVYRDPHSPTWARILGTIANSRDFKKAFSCPVTEPTCELW